MHSPRLPSFTLLACLLLSNPVANAQTAEKISVRILAFPQIPEPEPVELIVGENSKTIEVDTPGHELSKSYSVPALTTITVGKTTTDSEGKTIFQTYGSAKSIPAKEQIILLIRKGRANSDGFVILPINADLNDFKGASFLFINASNHNVAGKIGDKILQLEPGKRSLLQPIANFEGGVCQVTLAYQKQEKWKTFYDTRWPANEKMRTLVFFYQDPTTNRLGIAPISDIISKVANPDPE